MNNIKKILSMVLVLGLAACSMLACQPKAETTETAEASSAAATEEPVSAAEEAKASGETVKVAIVTDMCIDEAEWLQNLVAGLDAYMAEHSDLDIKVVEATDISEFEPKVRTLAEAGYQIIITMFSDMADATIAVANDYPEILFGSLDGTIVDLDQYQNIEEFGLNRTQTAFMAGVVAASSSQTGKVGIVAGADEPIINAIVAGWQQGLVYANPNIDDVVVYANSFTDPTKGKELGLSLYNKGCDVIGAAAGGTGVGSAQAAEEVDGLFVAWDVHYTEVFGDKALELGSAVNYFDVMVLQFISDATSGKFQAGVRVDYGMAEGVCDFESLDNAPLSDETKALVAQARAEITAGNIELFTEPLHK